jgi:hypothetical protein
MGRSVDIRLIEHQWHIRLEHLDKSATAEDSIDLRHRIQIHNSSILAKNTRLWTTLLERPLRLNSTLTVSTERVAFVLVNHESLLSAPQKETFKI